MQRTLLATASLAFVLGSLSTPAVADKGEVDQPVSYACTNGMQLSVSYLDIRGHGAVEIEFPDGREPGATAKQLLPATQTGSGVRYASDITEFHVKGDSARFATAVSAKSEAIPSVDCTRSAAMEQSGPITLEARAGRYFIDGRHTAAYAPVEAACLAPDATGYLGINRAAGQDRAVTYNGRGAKQAKVGPVDAGAGQRRYTLTSLRNPGDQITMHFIAPGMREADLPSATAGLNSLSQEGERVECVDNDRIVYAGVSSGLGLAITAEEDGLALRVFGKDKEPIWKDMRKGYVTMDDGVSVFHFFDGPSHIRVETSHSGMPGVDENGFQIARAWQLDTPIAQRSHVPSAYFIADQSILESRARALGAKTSQLLRSLSICNHLAGEVGDNADRNAQISAKLDAAKCDAVPGLYSDAVKDLPEGSPLHEYLKSNAPNWI